MIRAELCQKYPYFREEITALLEVYTDDASLEYMAQKYSQRYDITNGKERQKFFAALMRRGFRAEAIRSMLSENFDSF